MCNCFEEKIRYVEMENEVKNIFARAWLFDSITVNFRKWIPKQNTYSSRLGKKKFAIKYCPFCGEELPNRSERKLRSDF